MGIWIDRIILEGNSILQKKFGKCAPKLEIGQLSNVANITVANVTTLLLLGKGG